MWRRRGWSWAVAEKLTAWSWPAGRWLCWPRLSRGGGGAEWWWASGEGVGDRRDGGGRKGWACWQDIGLDGTFHMRAGGCSTKPHSADRRPRQARRASDAATAPRQPTQPAAYSPQRAAHRLQPTAHGLQSPYCAGPARDVHPPSTGWPSAGWPCARRSCPSTHIRLRGPPARGSQGRRCFCWLAAGGRGALSGLSNPSRGARSKASASVWGRLGSIRLLPSGPRAPVCFFSRAPRIPPWLLPVPCKPICSTWPCRARPRVASDLTSCSHTSRPVTVIACPSLPPYSSCPSAPVFLASPLSLSPEQPARWGYRPFAQSFELWGRFSTPPNLLRPSSEP